MPGTLLRILLYALLFVFRLCAKLFWWITTTKIFLCAASVFAYTFYLFGEEVNDENPPNELPTRKHFLAHSLRPVYGLVYDSCTICMSTPTKPVQLPYCGHIYCKECLEALCVMSLAIDVTNVLLANEA